MSGFMYLIERLSVGLYAFCALMFLFGLLRLLRARRDHSAGEFELERELANRKGSGAVTAMILAIEFALGIFAITTVVAPTMRNDALAAAPQAEAANPDQPFQTATPGGSGEQVENIMLTVTAQVASGGGGPPLVLTEQNPPTPVGTILPGYPTPNDCNTDQARLSIPANGQVIFDSLTVQGVANTTDFSFFKFELSGPATSFSFAPLGGTNTTPLTEPGVLGQIPLAMFPDGDYQFRLVVFDKSATLRASCTVNVIIRGRPPTETPFPTAVPQDAPAATLTPVG